MLWVEVPRDLLDLSRPRKTTVARVLLQLRSGGVGGGVALECVFFVAGRSV